MAQTNDHLPLTPNNRQLTPDQLARVKKIRALARFLDEAIRIPGTEFRIGFDGLIGLIPVLGDITSAGLGIYIVRQAAALGVPRTLLLRMLINLGADFLVGTVPVAGDIFDFLWKANRMNLRLLEQYLRDQGRIDPPPVIDV